jgi:hypothetical protein
LRFEFWILSAVPGSGRHRGTAELNPPESVVMSC